jgi:hypothetical protein
VGNPLSPDTDPSPDAQLATLCWPTSSSPCSTSRTSCGSWLGEAIRGEETARAVGLGLFATFQHSLESWVNDHRPDLVEGAGAPAVSRLLRAMVVGIFVEHAAGVLGDGVEARDTAEVVVARAQEAAQILHSSRYGAEPVSTGAEPTIPAAGA